MEELYREICEQFDWSYKNCGDGNIELEKYSPAGEDFRITVGEENFVDNVKAYAASFDQEEHIEKWVMARRNGISGVPSTQELVEDAKAIDNMLRELSRALFKGAVGVVGISGYSALFKCRLCGETFTAAEAVDRNTALSAAIYASRWNVTEEQAPDLHDIHTCEDGGIGIADFLGLKKGAEED